MELQEDQVDTKYEEVMKAIEFVHIHPILIFQTYIFSFLLTSYQNEERWNENIKNKNKNK